MRPIDDPAHLHPGSTLYHSAFGFARVREVAGDAVHLDWERAGAHLPREVRFDNLRRVYARCEDQGFFHRAVVSPDALRDTLHGRPGDALVWLLDDLNAPQRVRDVMDWFVGRNLFTPKTFVRWWGTAEDLLRSDHRLQLDGEWIRRVDAAEPVRLVQLEPGLVPSIADETLSAPLAAPTDDDSFDDDTLMDTADVAFPEPVPLVDAQPPTRSFVTVGRALADSLHRALNAGRPAMPSALSTVLHPDGTVEIETPDGGGWGDPDPAGAVHAAAVVLLQAFLGRPPPPQLDPADLLPFVRHRLPELPPSALAPLATALSADPPERPTPAAWLLQWRQVEHAERERQQMLDPEAPLKVGFDSHIGRVKLMQMQTNQDCLFAGHRGHRRLLVLCDGISVSDAGRGDLASKLATQAVGRLWENTPLDRVNTRRLAERALHLANRTICERALKLANGDLTHRLPMGTTIILAMTHGNRVHLAWLGDSRIYLLGEYGVALVSADDNVSGERFLAWCDGVARAWNPSGHALVRYLGHFDSSWSPAPFAAHHVELVLRPGERLLLCSDGITDYIDAHESGVARRIGEACQVPDPDEACRSLVNLANRLGGGDNASVFLLQVGRS